MKDGQVVEIGSGPDESSQLAENPGLVVRQWRIVRAEVRKPKSRMRDRFAELHYS